MLRALHKSAVDSRLRRASRLPLAISLFAASCALVLALTSPGGYAQGRAARVAVATENETATHEAMAELAAGGNAVDAIVRAVLVSGVVTPSSCGLGGGGFAMLWRAVSREPYVLDFRERAPAAIDAPAFEARPFKADERARYSGVPGELAGLYQLQHAFGKHENGCFVVHDEHARRTLFADFHHPSVSIDSCSLQE